MSIKTFCRSGGSTYHPAILDRAADSTRGVRIHGFSGFCVIGTGISKSMSLLARSKLCQSRLEDFDSQNGQGMG